jgi:hypothetical protein
MNSQGGFMELQLVNARLNARFGTAQPKSRCNAHRQVFDIIG